jgi:hypothetical protein
MVETVLASIVGALVSGAIAKSKDAGGKPVLDAYDDFKKLLVRKLGGTDTPVRAVEEDPQSEPSRELLTDALAKKNLADDPELSRAANQFRELLSSKAAETGIGNL